MNPRSLVRSAALAAALLAWSFGGASVARAYTIANAFSNGCHEKISSAALRAVRLELPAAAPLATNANERALVDDLQFTPDHDMLDLGAATLLVGVRDNDLKGRHATDLTELPLVHGDPKGQREHCLRGDGDVEPGGTLTALTNCRAFIREKVELALSGLDASGVPDVQKRVSISVYLALRHRVDASLPTYYASMGQAIHAVEDSFTHTFRTPDGLKITVALNWIRDVNGGLVEAVDGPVHRGDLDNCDDLDPLRKQRRELATEAVTAMLRATLAPGQSNSEKMAGLEGILDKYLGHSPGCTFENHWCDAVELKYGTPQPLACGLAGPGGATSAAVSGVLLALSALYRRMRRRRRTLVAVGLALMLAGPFVSMAGAADAQAVPPVSETAAAESAAVGKAVAAEAEHHPPPPVVLPVAEPGPRDPSETALGAYLGGAGSVSHGAFATAIGARLRYSKSWSFGLDAEWNAFMTLNNTKVSMGVFNAYGSAMLRVPLAYERFNLRTTLSLGMSRMLMSLYGVPKGSTGVYLGFSPFGIEWKLNRTFYLIANPLNIALPAPQLNGVPYVYPQYRVTIGFEVYAG
jgi:hypothetical protein